MKERKRRDRKIRVRKQNCTTISYQIFLSLFDTPRSILSIIRTDSALPPTTTYLWKVVMVVCLITTLSCHYIVVLVAASQIHWDSCPEVGIQ